MVDITEYTPVQIVWDVKQLLKEWKLETILPHLLAEKIDAEILEMIKIHHIRMLLGNFPLGVQIRFEHNLEQWRYNIGKPLYQHHCCQQEGNDFLCKPGHQSKHREYTNDNPPKPPAPPSPQTGEQPQRIRIIQVDTAVRNLPTPQESPVNNTNEENEELEVNNTTPPSTPRASRSQASTASSPTQITRSQTAAATATASSSSTSSTLSKDIPATPIPTAKPHAPVPKVNLYEILMNSKPEGPQFIKIYNHRKTFTKLERRSLLNVIVTYYLRNELRFDLQTSYALEGAILKMFPNERLEMYRKAKRGSLYCKYMNAKKLYYKLKDLNSIDSYMREEPPNDAMESSDMENIPFTDDAQSAVSGNDGTDGLGIENQNLYVDQREEFSYCHSEDNQMKLLSPKTEPVSEISIHSAFRLHREVIKLKPPISYKDFFAKACEAYSIPNMDDHYLAVNDCEISEKEFRNVILQYYKLPTFVVEVKQKASTRPQFHLNGKDVASSDPISFHIDANHLPNANEIRNIPSLLLVVGVSDSCKPLENKHRTAIAKAVIDECLGYDPERILRRQDFLILAQNICKAFPNEEETIYYQPALPHCPARGKLWSAYNNKRYFLNSSGMVRRRAMKRRKTIDVGEFHKQCSFENDFVEDTEEPQEEEEQVEEEEDTEEFSADTTMDWDSIVVKWSEIQEQRWLQLREGKLTPSEYMNKYSILKTPRGISLMEMDVKMLYPTVSTVNNWLTLYMKVVAKVRRKTKNFETLPKLITAIEESTDERYSANLALLLIPYILPHNGRKSELSGGKATKGEIQERFIKEYKSLDDLHNDPIAVDLQIRFVHSPRCIVYSEFSMSGCTFLCSDLMESLSTLFHYMLAMCVKYPKSCNHVWQFVQYAIFQIEPEVDKSPFVESAISDLNLS